MIPILFIVLILAIAASGLAYNALWILAFVLLLFWLMGYAGGPPPGGGPRRWYGRW